MASEVYSNKKNYKYKTQLYGYTPMIIAKHFVDKQCKMHFFLIFCYKIYLQSAVFIVTQ